MEKILGTIITIILIFYLLRFLFVLAVPLIMRHFMKKMEKKMGQQGGPFYSDFSTADNSDKEEGEVTINGSTQRKTNDKGQTMSEELGGEYVDFEEVK